MMITKLFGEIEIEKRMNIIKSGMVTRICDSSTRKGSVKFRAPRLPTRELH